MYIYCLYILLHKLYTSRKHSTISPTGLCITIRYYRVSLYTVKFSQVEDFFRFFRSQYPIIRVSYVSQIEQQIPCIINNIVLLSNLLFI